VVLVSFRVTLSGSLGSVWLTSSPFVLSFSVDLRVFDSRLPYLSRDQISSSSHTLRRHLSVLAFVLAAFRLSGRSRLLGQIKKLLAEHLDPSACAETEALFFTPFEASNVRCFAPWKCRP
jgi:hypothetical protein